MPTFILMIKSEPEEANFEYFDKAAGAYINCFVVANDFDEAEQIALKTLREENWTPKILEESWEVTEEDYKDDPEGLEVYKQVQIDKEIYTIHTYETEDE